MQKHIAKRTGQKDILFKGNLLATVQRDYSTTALHDGILLSIAETDVWKLYKLKWNRYMCCKEKSVSTELESLYEASEVWGKREVYDYFGASEFAKQLYSKSGIPFLATNGY